MRLYKTLLFACLFLICSLAFSQEFQIVDTTRFACTYNYIFLQDSNSRSSLKSQEMVLLIGSHSSKFSSLNELYADSLLYTAKDLDVGAAFNKIWPLVNGAPTNSLCKYKVYKNYPQKGDLTFISNFGKSYFQVSQKLDQVWKMDYDKDSIILGYHCKKASSHFAGRNYIAWFSIEVPVQEGPYKFNGLPGLIIKIYDTKNLHNFTLASLKIVKYKQPIFFVRNKSSIVSPEDFVKAMQANNADLIKSMQDGGKITFTDENSKIKVVQGLKSRNNFIERY